jgi:hypothetical protein
MIRIDRRLATSLILGLSLGLVWPSLSEAAKLSRFLTAQDVAARLILDQNGQQIQLPTAGDRHPELAKGVIPTYLVIPLYGNEQVPASIQTLITGSQQGQNPVGPLNFDTLVKSNLDSALSTSRLASVDTPTQNYLVEFLPRRAHLSLTLRNTAGTASNTVNELSNLLNTSSTQLTRLTQSGMNDLEKFLHISSKASTLKPSLNLEAQVLNEDVLPAAIPEPGAGIIFAGLIAGATMLQSRMAKRLYPSA